MLGAIVGDHHEFRLLLPLDIHHVRVGVVGVGHKLRKHGCRVAVEVDSSDSSTDKSTLMV